jgi:hypothetical protein
MDVAALIISIVAVLLALVVSAFAIILQFLMFKATSDQVARMGEQNAKLGERLASALTEIREITAQTRGTVDITVKDVIAAALSSVFPSETREAPMAEQAGDVPTGPTGKELVQWQRSELVSKVRTSEDMMPVLRLLQSKPEGASLAELRDAINYSYADPEIGDQVTMGVKSSRAWFALGILHCLRAIWVTEDGKIMLNPSIDVQAISAEAGGL